MALKGLTLSDSLVLGTSTDAWLCEFSPFANLKHWFEGQASNLAHI